MKIFITGGTSGIGKQTVELLVSSSHEVIFSGRDADRGNKIAIATGAKFIQGDLFTIDGCKKLADQYFQAQDYCDVLINNAGIWTEGTLEDTSDEEITNVFSVNSIAPIVLSKYFSSKMKVSIKAGNQDYARLVFVNSIAGLTSKAEREVYCATKWAITGFARGLSQELSPHKISVTNLCPGSIDTELFNHGGYPRDTSGMMDAAIVANSIKYIVDQPGNVQISELALHPTSYT